MILFDVDAVDPAVATHEHERDERWGKEPVRDDARLGVEASRQCNRVADVARVIGNEPSVGGGRDVSQRRVAGCGMSGS